jgi:hypothetical protein
MVERSREAGIETTPFEVLGKMHTLAVGWPIATHEMTEATDKVFVRFVLKHTQR